MGCRGNVKVKSDGREPVYLYSHWDAFELPKVVQRALRRKQRWNDEPYLARIIFSEMIKDNVDSSTGFGISAYPTDGTNRIVHVDVSNQKVILDGKDYVELDFDEFIQLDMSDINF